VPGPSRRRSPYVDDREVVAIGLPRAPWRDAYHVLLTISWRRFFALLVAGYLLVNTAFALGYLALGHAIENSHDDFVDAFFFSVQTLATIGYGHMAPTTLGANALVAVEALIGMIGLAVTTGLVYARFSRPTARVLFSQVAVVGPYEGVPSLMFRMANARGNQIVEARLRLTLVRDEVTGEGQAVRRLHDLRLWRSEHVAFALTWTAIHPIDAGSPLHGKTPEQLRASQSDLIVSLTGTDEGLAQTIHARHLYRAEDLRFGARLADILESSPGRQVIDYRKFHEIVPLHGEAAGERARAAAPAPASGAAAGRGAGP
jgi:inward rectifier potassium channel